MIPIKDKVFAGCIITLMMIGVIALASIDEEVNEIDINNTNDHEALGNIKPPEKDQGMMIWELDKALFSLYVRELK